jgi:hypothetical protein
MTRVSRPVSDYETGFLQKKICACLELLQISWIEVDPTCLMEK